MPNYLLEIGTEELPANFIDEARQRLKGLLSNALDEARLSYQSIDTYGTPRRLSAIINDLASTQATINKRVKGPPVKSSFDANKNPLPAALGFAQKHGIEVKDLKHEEISGTLYLMADLTVKGESASSVLANIIPQVINKISGERLMRWGNGDLKFSRPIRWIVSILDKEELKLNVDGIQSDKYTFGNRVLAPGKIIIDSPAAYISSLRNAKVLVDANERKQVILDGINKVAKTISGRARQTSGALLDEVVNITEWPSPILGEFAKEYLELPDMLIETVMVHHQRYFPLEENKTDGNAKLLSYFIAIANNDSQKAKDNIKQGNERVLKARLADGRFFYFDDLKTKLSSHREKLKQLTFQEGLGSYCDKIERLVNTVSILADSLNLETKVIQDLKTTAELCKNDLVTNLVRELPELQGYVGSWYAQLENQTQAVAAGIASHYSPRAHDDSIPSDLIGKLVSLVDKLDNIVGLFALGRRASGSSDPYALRRQCQGIIDILIDGLSEYRINVSALLELLLNLVESKLTKKRNFNFDTTMIELREFLVSRLRIKLIDNGFNKDIVESVLSHGNPLADVKDMLDRCRCLANLAGSDKGLSVIRAGVRIGNILNGKDENNTFDPKLFDSTYETELWHSFEKEVVNVWEANNNFVKPTSYAEYMELMELLSTLVSKVDAFFDNVMVNDPDMTKRLNRHGLLKSINCYFATICDFKKLQPLLL
jgi:glycyl-tRNA synthetase beta chain